LSRAAGADEALQLLQQAKLLAPDDPRVAAELGKALLSANRPQDALSEFGRSLALDPRNPQAFNNRGVALETLHQDAAARADFERALKLDPCSFDARYNLLTLGVRTLEPVGCHYTPEQRELLSR
jgi:Flp pilus assembly protein TadD